MTLTFMHFMTTNNKILSVVLGANASTHLHVGLFMPCNFFGIQYLKKKR